MEDVFTLTLSALAPLFILICIGYGLKKWSIMHHEHVPILNSLVINVFLPATITRALIKAPALTLSVIEVPAAMLVVNALGLGFLYLAQKRIKASQPNLGASLLTGAFGNTAFLGYPIAQAIVPAQFPLAVLVDEFGMMIMIYPVAEVLGSVLNSSHGKRVSVWQALLRFFRGPLFISIVLGIVLKSISLPESFVTQSWVQHVGTALSHSLELLSQATTPVILTALGLSLEPKGGDSVPAQLYLTLATKLILIPVLAIGIAMLLGIQGDRRTVLVLQAAMPASVLSSVLAHQYALGGKFGVKSVFLSTCFSAITIPTFLYLLQRLSH